MRIRFLERQIQNFFKRSRLERDTADRHGLFEKEAGLAEYMALKGKCKYTADVFRKITDKKRAIETMEKIGRN